MRMPLPKAASHSEQRSNHRNHHQPTVVLHPSRDLLGRHEVADEDGCELFGRRHGGQLEK